MVEWNGHPPLPSERPPPPGRSGPGPSVPRSPRGLFPSQAAAERLFPLSPSSSFSLMMHTIKKLHANAERVCLTAPRAEESFFSLITKICSDGVIVLFFLNAGGGGLRERERQRADPLSHTLSPLHS